MGPLAIAAIMAAIGAAKSEFVDRPKEDRQRKAAATAQRWSPWTGMQAGKIQEADTFGSALQGGMTGYSLGQGMEAQDLYKQDLERKAAERSAANMNYAAIPQQGAGMYGQQPNQQFYPWQNMYNGN